MAREARADTVSGAYTTVSSLCFTLQTSSTLHLPATQHATSTPPCNNCILPCDMFFPTLDNVDDLAEKPRLPGASKTSELPAPHSTDTPRSDTHNAGAGDSLVQLLSAHSRRGSRPARIILPPLRPSYAGVPCRPSLRALFRRRSTSVGELVCSHRVAARNCCIRVGGGGAERLRAKRCVARILPFRSVANSPLSQRNSWTYCTKQYKVRCVTVSTRCKGTARSRHSRDGCTSTVLVPLPPSYL